MLMDQRSVDDAPGSNERMLNESPTPVKLTASPRFSTLDTSIYMEAYLHLDHESELFSCE
jgi:hypothetical protein